MWCAPIWVGLIFLLFSNRASGKLVTCGKERVDDVNYICCNGIAHIKSWKEKTTCCNQLSYNPEIESCCNGLINPGYGLLNKEGQCCKEFSFDKRCFTCENGEIKPRFDYRHQTCCDGVIVELLPNRTCCCGQVVLNPDKEVCCEGKPQSRPKNMPESCCNCGLTKVDIVIVLDSSESITAPNWPKMLKFTTDILSEAEIDEDNVRVGVETYRHNSTVEFHMDAYHNKTAMFETIQKIPYVRGSTNTGMAIEMARTTMFIPAHGDRPLIDNVLIIVTDGDSDDYDYTIEQADITKASGIHIFAVGIALKNLTELRNMASPPVEQNVLSIDNFDDLTSLKGKIFASICTGTPIITVYKKCGTDEWYDPAKELCCNGKPVPIVNNQRTKCCGSAGYNEDTQFCCDGFVSAKKGKDTTCCGKVAMDPNTELCCGSNIVPRPGQAYNQCCGNYAFDANTEVCCEGIVNRAYGSPPKDTGCCTSISYDKRCFACVKNSIQPSYDVNCQLCCDGSIQNLTNPLSCCCGPDIFTPDTQICCNNVLRKRKGTETTNNCCECASPIVDLVLVIDSSESVGLANWELVKKFVQSIISNSDVDSGSTRIAVEVFRHNVTVEFKLNTYLRSISMLDHAGKIPYVRGSSNTALALEKLRTDMFSTQSGDRGNVPNVAVVITDGPSDDGTETIKQAALCKQAGIKMIAVVIGIPANDEIKAIASGPENVFTTTNFQELSSIQTKVFDVIGSVCPKQPTENKCKEPCGKKSYDPKTEVCCSGEPVPFLGGSAANTGCCGTQGFNQQEQMCCDGVVNKLPGGKSKPECCGKIAYDPSVSICCKVGIVVPKSSTSASACCANRQTYDPKKELCCNEVVYKNYGDNGEAGACCTLTSSNKTVSYDTRCYDCKKGELVPKYDCAFERCCDGVIQKIDYQNSCCCGKVAFDITQSVCCNGKLNSRKPADDPACCECPTNVADVVIVLDSSESVGLPNWQLMESFVEFIIGASAVPDVRFGVVIYRHNVSLVFNLNKYFDKPSMLAVVNNLPYIRGSTNTGLALQYVREQMFTAENGDRPTASNFVLLVTDGNSDDPSYTKTQADLLKKQDVRIVALGIAIKDLTELRDVASAPVDENAISLKNFDELQAVKDRIFKNLTSSVCPQKPEKRCGLPCGTTVYDPLTQVCCNGVPQPIKGGSAKNTDCCGKQSYDIKTEMCCDGKVNQIPSGKKAECCKEIAYNPDENVCCYNTTVIPISSKGATSCCGKATYNPIPELCCNDVIYKNYGDKGEAGMCCVDTLTNKTISYDSRCYDCLKPLYDCTFQRCCDGVIQEVFTSSSCCCGKLAFDPTDQKCCDNKLTKRLPDDDKTCCECPGSSGQVDIVFVLDSSESVGEPNWRRVETFTEMCIDKSNVPDIRFGLLTYRHNASVEFQLNKYADKNAILAAIKNLPYIRGSTNTGLALQTVREKMFTAAAGDRPDVPNVILLVTDGLSDDPVDTKTQADKTKAAGIKIVALGIGLSDDKELKAVASDPVEKNAVSLKSFDELNAVKQDLLSGVAVAKDCPQKPKDRCGTPCGNTTIDTRYQLCCKGVPQKKLAGNNTQCCGTVAYDPSCFICCDDHLVNKYAGDFTKCCCKTGYDNRTEICCGNQVLPLVAGKTTACCHNNTYDITSQVCCGYMFVQPKLGTTTQCCSGKSYDDRCDKCSRGKVEPNYDVTKQLCCGGQIQDKKFAERSCCCGNKQFDVDLGICCGEKYYDRPQGDEVSCCGSNLINEKKEICCKDNVNPRLNGFDTKCCGDKSYHPAKNHCCKDTINPKKEGDSCCCDTQVFDFTKMICCDGNLNKLAENGNRSSSVCCGNKAFSPSSQICCGGKVNILNKNGASTACCGTNTYDPAKQICEDGKVRSINEECRKIKYNSKTQTCCNGWINNATIDSPWSRCCFGEAYDARNHVCCCNGNLEVAVAGIFTQCCYSMAYDSRTHTCCDGQILRKPYPSAECCCERQAYDSNREICCGGKVRPCGGDKTQCCATEAYDPMLMICCNGKLHVRRYGEDTYCCGDEAYTPTLAACCGDRIAYTRKINMEW